ncbi:protein phosphatase CheZ [Rhodocyclus tenuis]|uniref:Protein phosphatase CheZ n=1 Tax=Rhodocyclus gracilis TaxID=2929842 RepID=A0ABX0WKE2_9RHOO|nr:protein phosphatase CheZ [Rhodocyclus gracilis]
MQQVREGGGDDSDELQALFDSVASQRQGQEAGQETAPAAASENAESAEWTAQEKVFNRVGQMARQLHDSLVELGYDKLLEKTVNVLPDAKDRLAYIANLTEQAACRVLNATDVANPIQEELESSSQALGKRWDAVFANQVSVEDFRALAIETREFLNRGVPQRTGATRAQLLEIMMAQDFQDLTGQVIKKIIALAQDLEAQLMNVLIETMPEARRKESPTGLMNGPVINASGRTDVVGSQQQVDDLLDSLGF